MMKQYAIAFLVCLTAYASPACADELKTNPFDRHNLSLTNGANNEIYGWIELLQGNELAGYLWVTNRPPREPFLSAEKKYIVMDFPIGMLDTLLNILRNEKPLQIRYAKIGNAAGTAFIERAQATPLSAERRLELSPK